MGRERYDGPADLLTPGGDLVAQVEAHLQSRPPRGVQFGSWSGEIRTVAQGQNRTSIALGNVRIRLPGGRVARAVVTEAPAGPEMAAALLGSGPPPF